MQTGKIAHDPRIVGLVNKASLHICAASDRIQPAASWSAQPVVRWRAFASLFQACPAFVGRWLSLDAWLWRRSPLQGKHAFVLNLGLVSPLQAPLSNPPIKTVWLTCSV